MTRPVQPIDSPLDDDAVRRDLKNLTVGGGVHMLAGQITVSLINLVALTVLARILSPRDYGLVALVLVVTSFMSLFSEAGLPLATVQYENLTHHQLSNLTWISGSIGLVLSLSLLTLARPMARLYDEPLVTDIAIGLAAVFFLRGSTVQQWALLRRQMRFKALAGIEVAAALISAATGIAAALLGAAYWALVVRELSSAAVKMFSVWLVSGWYPGRPKHLREMGKLVRFGGTFGLFGLVVYIRNNLDRLLIGLHLPAAQLGLYTRAFHISALPRVVHSPIDFVVIPALSRLQSEPARFERVFASALNALAWTTAPLAALILALANDVVLSVLGAQWLDAGPLLQILAIALITHPILAADIWLFAALGRASQMLRWGLLSLPVFAVAFLVGLAWGVTGVAIGFVVAALTTRMAGLLFASRGTPVRIRELVIACTKPYALATLGCIVMWLISSALPTMSAPGRLAAAGLGGFSAMALATVAWPAARKEVRDLFSYTFKALAGRRVERREGPA